MSNLTRKRAVDFDLPDIHDQQHGMGEFAGNWLLLVFHRHLAWLPCREHLSQLRQHESEIKQLGLQVVVVTFESPVMARLYVKETGVDWTFLIDADRTLYAAYGMHQGRWRNILGLRSWAIYAKLIWQGRRMKRASGDVAQLGGDVLIDPQGNVRLHHVGDGPADRPEVQEILTAIGSSPPD